MVFENRQEAGRQLAAKLSRYKNKNAIVLALPRGGIYIGFEVAKALHLPLDVIVSRKIGAPVNPEFGIGAISENNVQVMDEHAVKSLGISKEELKKTVRKEKKELRRRVDDYRNKKALSLANKIVILVDDGVATGVTARAAIVSIKKQKPKQVIFAVPVCALEAVDTFKSLADKFICIEKPGNLSAVGNWYKSFNQVEDAEVISLLKQNKL